MKIDDIKKRINDMIKLADNVLATKVTNDYVSSINSELFHEFRSASLSFLINTFGEGHPFYQEFEKNTKNSDHYDTQEGRGILKAAKQEIDGGWLISVKELVTSEIFSDFIEMAEYLLKENYKDPAAVIVGGVLEEHLRQLCLRNGINIEILKNDKPVSKKADLLNSELTRIEVYDKLDQKSVTSWLDLRNKAAHGKYEEYTQQQVELMIRGVTDFMVRTSN